MVNRVDHTVQEPSGDMLVGMTDKRDGTGEQDEQWLC